MISLAASFCVHVINGQAQGDKASFSSCTKGSSNLATVII